MKKILLFIVLMFSLNTVSQSWKQINHKLDKKNGFKEFKLGSSIHENKDEIEVISTKNNVTVCLYKGTKHKKLFTYEINSIFLKFLNDKLYQIEVAFEGTKNDKNLSNVIKYGSICIDLEKVFGKPFDAGMYLTGERSKSPPEVKFIDIDQSLNWKGKNVELLISYERILNSKYNICAKMVVQSLELSKSLKQVTKKKLIDDF